MSSLITIIYTEDQKLFSVLKPGGVSIAEEQLKECMQLAKQRVPHVLKLLHRNSSIFSEE
jgi:exosome complex RNA-binding protein Rrp42 (RNase PH superfamily)